MSAIDTALHIATTAHQGQKDRDGEAYILHPLTVGLMGRTDEERMAGFLHDVLEDSDITADQLLEQGIPDSVVNALQLLTHDHSIPYMQYVQNIIDSHNPIALRVKFNDLTHNYQRGKAYPDLQAKHRPALELVRQAVQDMDRVTLFDISDYHSDSRPVEVAAFAAGCFWGVQRYMSRQQGVIQTLAGYTGGQEQNPNYDDVRQHRTSHLEAVLVIYDPHQVSYRELAQLFFEIHDPGQTDGQGPDLGQQYLSGCFYSTPQQEATTHQLVQILRQKGHTVNTRIEPLDKFWIAEGYHQNYYDNTGGSPYCHIRTRKF